MSPSIKKILFPTDFSTAADNAYRYCLEMAELLEAEISVLHVYTLPVVNDLTLPTNLEKVYNQISINEFDNFKDRIPHMKRIADELDVSGVKVNFILEEGDVKEEILRHEEKLSSDLIIMGTQGASIIEKYFIGNHTSYIMENATVPVLGIPPNAMLYSELTSVVMCTDYSESDVVTLNHLIDYFPDFEEHLTTFHIDINPTEEVYKLHDHWEEIVLEKNVDFVTMESSSIVEGIQAYDRRYGMDMLVMRSHNQSPIKSFFNRDKAKDVVYSKTVPLLTIPEKYWKK